MLTASCFIGASAALGSPWAKVVRNRAIKRRPGGRGADKERADRLLLNSGYVFNIRLSLSALNGELPKLDACKDFKHLPDFGRILG